MIPLRHASAMQVAQVLNNLQAASRAAGETASVSIAVDDRSNSLLLSGPKSLRLRMRLLIAQLDEPAAAAAGNTEVIYLRYLEAKTFAPLLGKIAQNILGKGGNDASAPASSSPSAGTAGAGKSASKDMPENTTSIQAEPNSNAIIITAAPTLMKALKIVVNKLDIRPAQVLVEAIIAEIDEDNLMGLGIQWGSVSSGGTVSASPGGLATSFPPLGAGVVGIMPSTQIQAVLTILQNQNGVDILSTPSVVVLDNQKATIEVGQDVPMQTGQYGSTGSTSSGVVTPFTTIDRKPVTLKLDVTPQLNLGNSVRLKLDLKNDTLRNPQNPSLIPIVNTSKITNSVIINSNDILVLGGLISNSNLETVNKVPILSSIPIVGILFQQKVTNQQKKNLMVFIKPVIMHNSSDAMMISEEKYAETRSTQANFRNELADIGNAPASTLLPPWKNTKDLPKPFETPAQ
jgi:general secretion pathway protein D